MNYLKSTIIILSGGFDPVHSGHIKMFNEAKNMGMVFIALNSDEWLTSKKGKPFMSFEERKFILQNLKSVDKVFNMDDSDGTACDGIKRIYEACNLCDDLVMDIYFGNGGDRKEDNVPEVELCNSLGIKLLWNVGGGKTQSSSDLLKAWKE